MLRRVTVPDDRPPHCILLHSSHNYHIVSVLALSMAILVVQMMSLRDLLGFIIVIEGDTVPGDSDTTPMVLVAVMRPIQG